MTFSKTLAVVSLLAICACGSHQLDHQASQAATPAKAKIKLSVLGSYITGREDKGAAEIVAYSKQQKMAFVTNSDSISVDAIALQDPTKPIKQFSIDLKTYGSPNSVAVYGDMLAVAVEASPKQNPGKVVVFDLKGQFLNQFEVGALPDMLTFTPDGLAIIVANEGEPNNDYSVDPEGSVSIIRLTKPVQQLTQDAVVNADFKAFNNADLDSSIRIFGPQATVAQDLEPEYIALAPDGKTAWITLQENNAIANLDIAKARISRLIGLGTKSYNIAGNEIDANDKDDAINIRNWPVEGIYQPDSIAAYQVNNVVYLVTANEGDARDYDGYSEEQRLKDAQLAPSLLAEYPDLQKNSQLGRLKISLASGDTNNDGVIEQIHSFGARSFSIWNASNGEQVFDSGSDIARITAKANPALFNGKDKRSDDKGAEPEALAVGQIDQRWYAFIGLERTGGIMVYDISQPSAPQFVQYINNYNPEGSIADGSAGDVAPEGFKFVAAEDSPIKKPLLISANEVSGSTTVYLIETVN